MIEKTGDQHFVDSLTGDRMDYLRKQLKLELSLKVINTPTIALCLKRKRAITKKLMNVELQPLLIAHLLIILYTRVKFQQSTLNTLGVMGRTRISDGRTDIRDSNIAPTSRSGGIIMNV